MRIPERWKRYRHLLAILELILRILLALARILGELF